MLNNMNLDAVELVLDIGRQANDDLSRWYTLIFINNEDCPVMNATMAVHYDRFTEACTALRIDPVKAAAEAFVTIQSPHFGPRGHRAIEKAWVKTKAGMGSIEATLYHFEHDNRAVVVVEEVTGIYGEVFESRSDAANAFNREVAKANETATK